MLIKNRDYRNLSNFWFIYNLNFIAKQNIIDQIEIEMRSCVLYFDCYCFTFFFIHNKK